MKVTLDSVVLDSTKKGFANNLSLSISDSMAFIGEGPCGKSYLMSVIAGVVSPEAGKVFINDKEVLNVDDEEQLCLRRRTGAIFHKHTLLSNLTLFANLRLFLMATRFDLDEGSLNEIIEKKLARVNLLKQKDAKLIHLSDGQLNVASFIKATIHEPKLLLWDNPFQNVAKEYHHFMIEEINYLRQRDALVMCFSSDHNIAKKLNLNIEMLGLSKMKDVA